MKVKGHKANGGAWRVAVEKPKPLTREVQRILELQRQDGIAVMTSGTYRNYFEADGKTYSHIIDPRTGMPVNHQLLSTTVLHEDPTLADAWSTALLCVGETEGLRIEQTAPTDNAEVMLRLQGGHLWLLEPGAALVTEGPRKAPSIAVTNTQALAGVVETHLQPLAKALNLLRLVGPLDEAASTLRLDVDLSRQAKGAPIQKVESKPGAALTFNPGDKLKLIFKNAGTVPLDVTVLYIDSRFGIAALYPTDGALNRLLPGDQGKVEGTISAKTTGQERVLFIATRAEARVSASNFTYLAQAGVPETVRKGPEEPIQRGSARGEVLAFEDTLLRAGFGPSATRGFDQTIPAHETATLRVLQWRVAAP